MVTLDSSCTCSSFLVSLIHLPSAVKDWFINPSSPICCETSSGNSLASTTLSRSTFIYLYTCVSLLLFNIHHSFQPSPYLQWSDTATSTCPLHPVFLQPILACFQPHLKPISSVILLRIPSNIDAQFQERA